MLESYEVGQKITRKDISSGWYMPLGEWTYAVVESIGDNSVELVYHDLDGYECERMVITKDQMDELLGWDIEKGDVDDGPEVVEHGDEPISDDVLESALTTYPVEAKHGPYELLSCSHGIFLEVIGSRIRRIHHFDSREACVRSFNAHARQL